jgi:hypothetical protein
MPIQRPFQIGDRVEIITARREQGPVYGTIRHYTPLEHMYTGEAWWHIQRDDREAGGGMLIDDIQCWVARDEELLLAPFAFVPGARFEMVDPLLVSYGPGILHSRGINTYWLTIHDNGSYDRISNDGTRVCLFDESALRLAGAPANVVNRPTAKRYGPYKPIARRLPA